MQVNDDRNTLQPHSFKKGFSYEYFKASLDVCIDFLRVLKDSMREFYFCNCFNEYFARIISRINISSDKNR
jgi:hypothetical protein